MELWKLFLQTVTLSCRNVLKGNRKIADNIPSEFSKSVSNLSTGFQISLALIMGGTTLFFELSACVGENCQNTVPVNQKK